MTDTQKLRELLAKATPGPWEGHGLPYRGMDDPVITSQGGMYICQLTYDQQSITQEHDVDADAALIVAAINALPELLNEVEMLRAERDRMREALARIAKPQYGYQSIVEDGDDPVEKAEYFSRLSDSLQAIARAALKETDND